LQELTFSVLNATQFPNQLNGEAQVLLPEVDTLGVEIRPRRGQFGKAEFRELLKNVTSHSATELNVACPNFLAIQRLRQDLHTIGEWRIGKSGLLVAFLDGTRNGLQLAMQDVSEIHNLDIHGCTEN
jgi:hypothetical protein